MAVPNWRACVGVNPKTGRVRPGYRAVRGRCPRPTHDTPSVAELVSPLTAGLSRAGTRRRRRV